MKFEIPLEKYSETLIDGKRQVTATVRLSELPLMPYKAANVRELNTSVSDAYKAMKEQCRTEEGGRLFQRLHAQGVQVAVASLRIQDGMAYLEIDEAELVRQGVLNGNHTQFAADYMRKHVEEFPGLRYAKLELKIGVGLDPEEIIAWAIASNNSLNQKRNDKLNALGVFDVLFEHITPETEKVVQRKSKERPRAEAPYEAGDLIKLLALLDVTRFPVQGPDLAHPRKAYSGVGGISNEFAKGYYHENLPLLKDAIKLDLLIRRFLIDHSSNRMDEDGEVLGNLWRTGKAKEAASKEGFGPEPEVTLSGVTLEKTCAKPFVAMVIAAFRVFVKNGKFVDSVEDLFEEFGDQIIRAVYEDYQKRATAGIGWSDFGKLEIAWLAALSVAVAEAIDYGVLPRPERRKKKSKQAEAAAVA